MRQALRAEVTEAFTHLYRIYEPQVIRWVYNHSRFESTGERADYFSSSALSQFYFSLRGSKFDKFSALPQILTYLKLCVHTAIMQYLRDHHPTNTISLDDADGLPQYTNPNLDIFAGELWNHICSLLPDQVDRTLAQLVFVQHLKPAQIVAQYPERWNDERTVSVALQRIRRNLRKDNVLRQWAGIGSSEPTQEDSI